MGEFYKQKLVGSFNLETDGDLVNEGKCQAINSLKYFQDLSSGFATKQTQICDRGLTEDSYTKTEGGFMKVSHSEGFFTYKTGCNETMVQCAQCLRTDWLLSDDEAFCQCGR